MLTRSVTATLAFTSLIVLASIAAAGPCQERVGPLGNLGLLPAVPLVESADVIVVLRPHVDIVTISSVERVVAADIERVEKGAAPRTIIYTANSFGAWVRAGVRTKVFLRAYPGRDAHYIIAATDENAPRTSASVSVSASAWGFTPERVTRIGSSILIEALVTVEERAVDILKFDLYVGFQRPDGTSAWVSGTALAPTLVESATPIPFLVDAPGRATGVGITYQFTDADPRGWYTLYGVLVLPGRDPREPCNWFHTATFPLLVTDPVASPQP